MICFLLPKKIRKIIIYTFIFVLCISIIFGFSFSYVINNLNHIVKKNKLKITNTTSLPITIYSINEKILDQVLNKNESCVYKILKKEDINICTKFVWFSYKYQLKSK